MTIHFPLTQIRNIGIIAHIDAGKTTLTERVLFYSGRTYRVGNVDDGTTVTDWMAQERERGITITAAAITTTWQDAATGQRAQINLIDTPGHIDFTAEVQRSLRVLDGGVVVFDGVAGVEPQSETVWRQADRFGVPRICFINKLDRPGANVERTLQMMRDRLHATPALVQLPIVHNGEFVGVVDLFEMQALLFSGEPGALPEMRPIPADMLPSAEQARHTLLESIVETDTALMERFLEGDVIPNAELYAALRRATIANTLTPVLLGSALHNRGIQPVLDAIVRYLPNPLDIPPVQGHHPTTGEPLSRPADPAAPFCGLVFKVVSDPFMGRMNYVRVYSGTLTAGGRIDNASRQVEERVARVLQLYANKREDVKVCTAGDIVGVIGFKQSFTGDTLCAAEAPILLEAIEFPTPVIRAAITPLATLDLDRLMAALRKLADEDPTFTVGYDEQTRETIIAGMGELHLDIIADRLRREFNVPCNVAQPQAAYQETITRRARGEGRYIHQAGGAGRFGVARLTLSPNARGAGVTFENRANPMELPEQYVPAIEKGVRDAMQEGELAAYPVTDVAVVITGGRFHEVDSHRLDFEIAGSLAFKDAYRRAAPMLLEPIMRAVTRAPDTYVGAIVSDFGGRRGQITQMALEGADTYVVEATVPLSSMFGYVTVLRDRTSGRGTFTLEFTHYASIPDDVALPIIEARREYVQTKRQ
ncbi:MAG TPA: elongation factor G [Anaerolineae bacterium]|nr:elongation factor G [Anaerolineae bacterium]HQI86840.1 elongation factor G [Anaerolineae bacterium]